MCWAAASRLKREREADNGQSTSRAQVRNTENSNQPSGLVWSGGCFSFLLAPVVDCNMQENVLVGSVSDSSTSPGIKVISMLAREA